MRPLLTGLVHLAVRLEELEVVYLTEYLVPETAAAFQRGNSTPNRTRMKLKNIPYDMPYLGYFCHTRT